MRSILASILALCFLVSGASAFVTPQQTTRSVPAISTTPSSSTQLHERQWNFNEGQGPFGLKKNAEIWNGRVAQMAFVFVVIQELVQGKGVIQGISEGDPANIAGLGAFALTMAGLTGFLALKGANDYVGEALKKKD